MSPRRRGKPIAVTVALSRGRRRACLVDLSPARARCVAPRFSPKISASGCTRPPIRIAGGRACWRTSPAHVLALFMPLTTATPVEPFVEAAVVARGSSTIVDARFHPRGARGALADEARWHGDRLAASTAAARAFKTLGVGDDVAGVNRCRAGPSRQAIERRWPRRGCPREPRRLPSAWRRRRWVASSPSGGYEMACFCIGD
jgi:hypothetical protein